LVWKLFQKVKNKILISQTRLLTRIKRKEAMAGKAVKNSKDFAVFERRAFKTDLEVCSQA
jgi:hypothetical protein